MHPRPGQAHVLERRRAKCEAVLRETSHGPAPFVPSVLVTAGTELWDPDVVKALAAEMWTRVAVDASTSAEEHSASVILDGGPRPDPAFGAIERGVVTVPEHQLEVHQRSRQVLKLQLVRLGERSAEEILVFGDGHEARHDLIGDAQGVLPIGQLVGPAIHRDVAGVAAHLFTVEERHEHERFESGRDPFGDRDRRNDPSIDDLHAAIPEERAGVWPDEERRGVPREHRALPERPSGRDAFASLADGELKWLGRAAEGHMASGARGVAIAAQLAVEEERLAQDEDGVVFERKFGRDLRHAFAQKDPLVREYFAAEQEHHAEQHLSAHWPSLQEQVRALGP